MSVRLEGHHLVVRHGPVAVLRGVDVALRAGGLTALVGPNGSGKSTLLRVLIGAQQPDEGSVTLDGAPLKSLTTRQRARTLTMVAQGRAPDFPLSARDLVALGRIPHEGLFGLRTREDDAAIDEALARTETTALADRPLEALSDGELQRVHLARAFAQQASVVLLDEPTANLEPLHQLAAMQALRTFVADGGTALVAMHDLTLAARHCDRVLVLERGQLRADGPPLHALREEVLAEVFCVHARVALDAQGDIDHVIALEPIRRDASKGRHF
jgi:iron complex transport system ATP-binding protein